MTEIDWRKKKPTENINIHEITHEKAIESVCNLSKMSKNATIEERAQTYAKCGGFVSASAPTLESAIKKAETFEKYGSSTKLLVRWHGFHISNNGHYEILIHPKELAYMVNGTSLKDIKAGKSIKEEDLDWKEGSIKEFKNKKELYNQTY